ncbi:MAG: DsrE family protein [Myxococcota bacterium]
MRTRSLSLIVLPFLCAMLVSPIAAPIAAAADSEPVIVHLGHFTDDLHAASMALGIANMLQKGGSAVTLFLDREGVRLADSRVPQDLRWGKARPIADAYSGFVKAGGTVLLCSHCAEAAGIDESHLRQGARLGSDESVAAAFAAATKVIDY